MTHSLKSICVIIPAYNAGQTLPNVVERIPESTWNRIRRVFIINDGSRDDTEHVALELARDNEKIEVLTLALNQGYGAAVRRGLGLCKDYGCDYAVCLHADGQYPPEDIQRGVDTMCRGKIDILQGSRHKDGTALQGNMPLYKFIAGKILTRLENAVFRLNLTDYHSGFLFYSRRAVENLPFSNLSSSFDFDLEVIASARARGMVIDEIGIPTRYADEKSYLNPLTYGARVLSVVIRYALGAYHDRSR